MIITIKISEGKIRFARYVWGLLRIVPAAVLSAIVLDKSYVAVDHANLAWYNPNWIPPVMMVAASSLSLITCFVYLAWAHRLREAGFKDWLIELLVRHDLADVEIAT